MRHFGKCSKWEAMRSLQHDDHRRLLFAISTMCSIRRLPLTISIQALLVRPTLIQHLLPTHYSRLLNCRYIAPFRKSYPDPLMMQSRQHGNGDNDTGPLDCSMRRRISGDASDEEKNAGGGAGTILMWVRS